MVRYASRKRQASFHNNPFSLDTELKFKEDYNGDAVAFKGQYTNIPYWILSYALDNPDPNKTIVVEVVTNSIDFQ